MYAKMKIRQRMEKNLISFGAALSAMIQVVNEQPLAPNIRQCFRHATYDLNLICSAEMQRNRITGTKQIICSRRTSGSLIFVLPLVNVKEGWN